MATTSTDRLMLLAANDSFRQGDDCMKRLSFDEAACHYRKAERIYADIVNGPHAGEQAAMNLGLARARQARVRVYKRHVCEELLALDVNGTPDSSYALQRVQAHKDTDFQLPAHANVILILCDRSRRLFVRVRSPDEIPFSGRFGLAVSGHVQNGLRPDADAAEAVIREAREEAELSLDTNKLRRIPDQEAPDNRFDLRSDLLMYEFVGLTPKERNTLWNWAFTLRKENVAFNTSPPSNRVLVDCNLRGSTLQLYAFDRELKPFLESAKDALEANAHIPVADLHFAAEAKACFVYPLEPREIAIIRQRADCATWRLSDLQSLIRQFLTQPTSYTDVFIPLLTEEMSIASLRCALRDSAWGRKGRASC